jgi:hypothetical protein
LNALVERQAEFQIWIVALRFRAFGCMRLATVDGNLDGPNIDQAKAVRMIGHAVDQDVNQDIPGES